MDHDVGQRADEVGNGVRPSGPATAARAFRTSSRVIIGGSGGGSPSHRDGGGPVNRRKAASHADAHAERLRGLAPSPMARALEDQHARIRPREDGAVAAPRGTALSLRPRIGRRRAASDPARPAGPPPAARAGAAAPWAVGRRAPGEMPGKDYVGRNHVREAAGEAKTGLPPTNPNPVASRAAS